MLEWIINRTFLFWQKLGVHVRPNHFYEPIPDTKKLRDLWSKPSDLVGVRLDAERQMELLEKFEASWKQEYESLPRAKTSVPHQYFVDNGVFESVNGEILYCMIRNFVPSRIVEIGSGYSSYLAAQAIRANRENKGRDCELICIEPYPGDVLRKGFTGLTKIVEREVQDVPLSLFQEMGNNDILFIDSSHVLKAGSDVQYEYLEILPRLRKGVIVHIHDIFLPSEYPKDWILQGRRFWNEQYLLQAFLSFNDSFEVLWAGSYMHLRHADALERVFSSYRREDRWPGSFWLKKTK